MRVAGDQFHRCPISMRLPAGSRMKKRRQALGHAFFFDGRHPCATTSARAAARSSTQKADMPFAVGRGLGIHADVELHIAHLKPRPAAGAQFRGLGDFGQRQNLAVEGEAFGLQRAGHGHLHMIYGGYLQCASCRLPVLRPDC